MDPYFCRMSSTVPTRPLSLVPFLAADGVLLLTALVIAWRTSGELTGGALVGVVVCVALGAVLTVVTFALKDARDREDALAERQKELVALVNASNDNASRWGAQWAAAATGLEDAAKLATRNLAAAEQLPGVFQEKIDALAQRLDQAEREARERDTRTAGREEQLARRMAEITEATEALKQTLAERERELVASVNASSESAARLGAQWAAASTALENTADVVARNLAAAERLPAAFQEKIDALSQRLAQAEEASAERNAQAALRDEALALRVGRLAETAEELKQALVGFSQLETSLREQGTALAEKLTEANAEQSRSWHERFASLETSMAALAQQIAELHANASKPIPVPEAAVVSPFEQPVVIAAVPVAANKDVAEAPAETPPPAEKARTIMDPFYIPSDGYSALAEAMDEGHV